MYKKFIITFIVFAMFFLSCSIEQDISIEQDVVGELTETSLNEAAIERSHAAVKWKQIAGRARDIGAGADGSVYVIGWTWNGAGYGIYRWTGSTWTQLPGSATRIDVDPSGKPWVVNSNGNIYRWTGSQWINVPGRARDIGIGAHGSVYVIGWTWNGAGYGIYRWTGSGWTQLPGSATKIDVDSSGKPWVVNSNGYIYRWTGSQWIQVSGRARDIGIGGYYNSTYVIGWNTNGTAGYGIYFRAGNGWIGQSGSASVITVDRAGLPWVINAQGYIYQGY